MKSLSNIRRVVSLAGTTLVFAGVAAVVALQSSSKGDASKDETKPSWPMYGGDLSRNLVNLKEKGISTTWDVEKNTNIKWSVDLGSKAYGGPVVAGGRIFVGTNNDLPRDPAIQGDKGVLMCFDEPSG